MRHFPQSRKGKWDIKESQAMPRTRSLIIQRKTPFAGRVENGHDYLNQAEPMNCRVRRTSYTMDGFCLLYLLLILLMRSGDVETNPGPNTAESTVSDVEFMKLAQDIPPSQYYYVGMSLGFAYARVQKAIISANLTNCTNALLEVFMLWKVMQHPHSNEPQRLAEILRKLDLGSLSDGLLNGPPIPNSTADMREESTSTFKSELMTREPHSQVEEKKKNEEDLAWDEQDWDEKDSLDLDDEEEAEMEEEADEEDVVGQNASEKKTKNNTPPADEGTRVYPADLWYVLADYIRPKDITTFSCLCKAAYSITRTESFWKKLYYRYYNSSTALPPYLRPEQIPRTGLRTFVIRALYYLYEPYRLALNTTSPVGEGLSSPEAVTDFTCLSLRCQYSQPFTYFLKLWLESREGVSYYPNIFPNDDRGKCILRIRCKHFQNVPLAEIVIKRLQLVRVSVSVSANMFTHRVKLEFGRKDRRGLYVKSSIIPVFLDPVLKVDVLHWWHPQFMEFLQMPIGNTVDENAANDVWEGRV